jgi:murein lipoprotein
MRQNSGGCNNEQVLLMTQDTGVIGMTHRIRKLAVISLAAAYVGLSGCATTGDLDALKADVSAASAEASAARAEAAEAKALAAQANATANEAKAMSEETETKIDRMFKKAMHK